MNKELIKEVLWTIKCVVIGMIPVTANVIGIEYFGLPAYTVIGGGICTGLLTFGLMANDFYNAVLPKYDKQGNIIKEVKE